MAIQMQMLQVQGQIVSLQQETRGLIGKIEDTLKLIEAGSHALGTNRDTQDLTHRSSNTVAQDSIKQLQQQMNDVEHKMNSLKARLQEPAINQLADDTTYAKLYRVFFLIQQLEFWHEHQSGKATLFQNYSDDRVWQSAQHQHRTGKPFSETCAEMLGFKLEKSGPNKGGYLRNGVIRNGKATFA